MPILPHSKIEYFQLFAFSLLIIVSALKTKMTHVTSRQSNASFSKKYPNITVKIKDNPEKNAIALNILVTLNT